MGIDRRIEIKNNNINKENSLMRMFGLLGIVYQYIRMKFSSLFPGRPPPDVVTMGDLGNLFETDISLTKAKSIK